jgi:hypothetical protein
MKVLVCAAYRVLKGVTHERGHVGYRRDEHGKRRSRAAASGPTGQRVPSATKHSRICRVPTPAAFASVLVRLG